jgi:hypothetical protein
VSRKNWGKESFPRLSSPERLRIQERWVIMTKSARRLGSTFLDGEEFREFGFIEYADIKSASAAFVRILPRNSNFNQAGNSNFFK